MNKLLLVLCAVLTFSFASCYSTSEPSVPQQVVVDNHPIDSYMARAIVLESGTVSYVYLNDEERWVLHVGDCVWVNLRTHKINDISNTTMKCRLEKAF